MRTKTLVCMAALAAGVATSMAQNVYSLNIVGYYNVPITTTFTATTCSFRVGSPQNRLDQLGIYSDGDGIQMWTGTKFKEYGMDSASATGWTDPSTGTDIPLASLPVASPGVGFFFSRTTTITNITFVGEVPTGTNTVSIPTGFSMLGSPIPYAGLVSTVDANNKIGCPVPDGSSVQKWNGSKWVGTDRDSASATGWTDPSTGNPAPEPTLTVGQSFFLQNSSGAIVPWVQILNP